MRRATGISISLHGAALATLLAATVSAPPPPPTPLAPPKPITVALAPLPTRKPPPAPAAVKPPEPQPVPRPPQPQPKPKRPPQPVKPATRPAPATVAPIPAAPLLAAEPAPASPAPAAPDAPPAPAAPPAIQSAGPDTSWLGAVRAQLEAVKRYPSAAARRGEQGVATIRLEIAPDGRILSVSLSAGSGSRLLDREALDLPERIPSLPPMPDSMGRTPITLVVPISFALR